MTGRLFAPENFQSKRVKIAGKRSKRKVCEQKADESCWWVTWMGDRRLRLSCPKNSFGSKNLDFLSPKVRRLPEFEFLVLKTQRMDALSQTQSNVSFLDTCKKQNFKKPCTLQGFVEISYYQNCWNFEGCCCTLTTKFELIIAVRPLCSSFLLSSAGSFVWTEKVEVI